jgi:hypothetical protein
MGKSMGAFVRKAVGTVERQQQLPSTERPPRNLPPIWPWQLTAKEASTAAWTPITVFRYLADTTLGGR